MIYYVKEDNYIYRFSSFSDLEILTGKSRALMRPTLAESIRQFFPRAEFCARPGAFYKGWLDINGMPTASLRKGNSWLTMRGNPTLDKLA